MQSSDKPLRLGGNTEPHGYFQGRIDEVRVYRRARTLAEIQADMSTPLAAAALSPDLVAAYNFEEGAGSVLTDISGHGNTDRSRGRPGPTRDDSEARSSSTASSAVVVIPHSSSLDLTEAMTLEAWIYPTAAQTGWRAVLQKEFDAYFLLAGSRAGALRPAGGATFGSSTETMATPTAVPTNAWTHLALTYDGAVLQLYVDGRPVTRRLRWYPGRIVAATLDGLTIPNGISAESRQLRAPSSRGRPVASPRDRGCPHAHSGSVRHPP